MKCWRSWSSGRSGKAARTTRRRRSPRVGTAQPQDGKAAVEVQCKADTEGGKPPLKYKWTFGDGTPDSDEANPKHTFEKAGKYRADLTVNDAAGDSDTDYVEIEVE